MPLDWYGLAIHLGGMAIVAKSPQGNVRAKVASQSQLTRANLFLVFNRSSYWASGDIVLQPIPDTESVMYWNCYKIINGAPAFCGDIQTDSEPTPQVVHELYFKRFKGGRYRIVPVFSDRAEDDSRARLMTLAEEPAEAPAVATVPIAQQPSGPSGIGSQDSNGLVLQAIQQLSNSLGLLAQKQTELEARIEQSTSAYAPMSRSPAFLQPQVTDPGVQNGVSAVADLMKAMAPMLARPEQQKNGNDLDMFKMMMANNHQTMQIMLTLITRGSGEAVDPEDKSFERMAKRLTAARVIRDMTREEEPPANAEPGTMDLMERAGDKLVDTMMALKNPAAYMAMRGQRAAEDARGDATAPVAATIGPDDVADALSDPRQVLAFFGSAKSAQSLEAIRQVLAQADPETRSALAEKLGFGKEGQ